jgi:hypothetical protein
MAELEDEPQLLIDDDVDFGDANELRVEGISDARWERVKTQIDVRDVLYMFHNRRSSPMSCPFHGRDSKPSFYVYIENNDCHCFGCPDGDNYWDNVKIVARTLEINRPQALRYLEREFKLPKLEEDPNDLAVDLDDLPEDDEEDEAPSPLLTFADIAPAFIATARKLIKAAAGTTESVPTATTLLECYFTAEKHDDPLPLARVVGAETVRALIKKKG